MAVQTIGSKIEEILGDEAAGLLQHQCKTIPRETLHLPGPDYVDRIYSLADRQTRVLGSLQSFLSHGRLAGTGLRVDPSGRSGHRTFSGRVVRAEPDVFRSREHREAGDRGRMQRGGVDARRAGIRGAEIRAQDSVPGQDQPQRVHHVSERVRSDHVWERAAGVRHGRARPSARRSTSARKNRSGRSWKCRSSSSRRTSSAWRRCCGATCATRPSRRRTRTITWPPTSPARPITSA